IEKGTANAQMVNRVGTRIAAAVETFLKNNGYESEIQNYSWEFNLVKDNSVNAFAMPGGKVVVYTGLLPVTQNEETLAVVVGHEIAHVVAKHSHERLSQQVATQYGGAIAGGLLGGSSSGTKQLAQAALGLGAQYGVMLPYARTQELEADELGLIFMAMAGYNPQVAISFWKRMSQQSQGGSGPEFMSTHPNDAKRIAQIESNMPNILPYYKGSGVSNNTSSPIKTKTNVPAKAQPTKTSKDWTF
ncbi:MAG TPA: peptidase M48 family protein, partial [Porphyromonadaceae bacterium]|nr:peptidase M48 family protein [Porphyromonadaceae bacterium]